MTQITRLLIKIGLAIAFFSVMLATYWNSDDDWRLYLISVFSLAVIAVVDYRQRQLYPALLIFLIIRTVEFCFSLLVVYLFGFSYLLFGALIEILFAFVLVHYYQDQSLHRLCKVEGVVPVFPQLFWVALLLGFSCFYRLAAAVELILFEMDNNFFGERVPFFFSTGPTVMIVVRLLIDVILWSLLLFPRKLSQFGHHRPSNLPT